MHCISGSSKQKLISGESGSGWMMNRLKDGSKFYYNTKSKTYKWSRPDGVVKDHGQLNKEEIQVSHAGLRRKANTAAVWKFKWIWLYTLKVETYCFSLHQSFQYIVPFNPGVIHAVYIFLIFYSFLKVKIEKLLFIV